MLERGPGVLRRVGRTATVRERDGTGMIEERYVHERIMP
jgi:hypothetical protein